MSSVPACLKQIVPYMKRAAELDSDNSNDSKIVAYFCRNYAVSKGMDIRKVDSVNQKEITDYLMMLMTKLESDKAALGNDSSMEVGRRVCENFAQFVFSKADDEDRARRADKNTAQTFYAASSFFDVLEQFGELDEECQERRKYSKWKAADIIKAIKEGRTPTPGDGTESNNIPSGGARGSYDGNNSLIGPNAIKSGDIPEAPKTFIPAIPKAPMSDGFSSNVLSAPVSLNSQSQSQSQGQPQPQPPSTFEAYLGLGSKPLSSTSDPRVKDAIELSQFAIAALKVSLFYGFIFIFRLNNL